MSRNIFSVAYVVDKKGIWLGLKKKRLINRQREQLGVGLYNGFGGLKKLGETIELCAKREAENESGFQVLEMKKCGVALILHNYDAVEIELHFYLIIKYQGKARETDEMVPEFFSKSKIPYDKMWPTDYHILPKFLSGQNCIALFTIDREKNLVKPPLIEIVTALPETINRKSFQL